MNNLVAKAAAPLVGVTLLAFLSGCSNPITPVAAQTPDAVSQAATVAPEFFGSWSITPDGANEPALSEAPAAIATDGSVELLFMFTTDVDSLPIVSSHVESADGFLIDLTCLAPSEPNNQWISCMTPRFTDPMDSTDYRAVIETSADQVEGTATITRVL
jgi:hypothetical protein